MYNLNGIAYRILISDGSIFVLALIVLILSRFWNVKKRDKKGIRIAVATFVLSLGLMAFHGYKLFCPQIAVHEGFFDKQQRESHISFTTTSYTFTNNGNPKPKFYMDTFSKREIFNEDFQKGSRYRIYYEESMDIIVKVEKLDND